MWESNYSGNDGCEKHRTTCREKTDGLTTGAAEAVGNTLKAPLLMTTGDLIRWDPEVVSPILPLSNFLLQRGGFDSGGVTSAADCWWTVGPCCPVCVSLQFVFEGIFHGGCQTITRPSGDEALIAETVLTPCSLWIHAGARRRKRLGSVFGSGLAKFSLF